LIRNQNLPTTPKHTIILETPGGSSRVLHYQEPKINMLYGQGQQQQMQTRDSRIYLDLQEEKQHDNYTVLYVLFAVLMGVLVDFALGSPFLTLIGAKRGSVSPFVSSVRSFVPSVSSISSNAVPSS